MSGRSNERWSSSSNLWLLGPNRRSVLSGAVGGVAMLLGCGHRAASSSDAAAPDAGDGASIAPDGPANELKCTTRQGQIVGPYPGENVQLERADIRSDPGNNNAVKPGVPLRVVFRVGRRSGLDCTPLGGAVVNVWQCDANGSYASYASLGTASNQFLRGYQLTDRTGVVEFQTIYPGSYPGRSVHLHFSVRQNTSVAFPGGAFVGQLYFPDEVTDEILLQPPYSAAGRTTNAQDGFYKDDMLATVSRQGPGWIAELELGV